MRRRSRRIFPSSFSRIVGCRGVEGCFFSFVPLNDQSYPFSIYCSFRSGQGTELFSARLARISLRGQKSILAASPSLCNISRPQNESTTFSLSPIVLSRYLRFISTIELVFRCVHTSVWLLSDTYIESDEHT